MPDPFVPPFSGQEHQMRLLASGNMTEGLNTNRTHSPLQS